MNAMASYNFLSRRNFIEEESNTLAILVIGNEVFCKELCQALMLCHKEKNNTYKLQLITCAEVDEILYHTNCLQIDFVVFLMDTRMKTCTIEVECNLQKMHKSFLCGRSCIVNANPHIPASERNIPLESVVGLKMKYDLALLNGDVMNSEGCSNLAQRLIILIETNLGVKQKYPFLPWLNDGFK